MPRALFTPTSHSVFNIAEICSQAKLVSSVPGEDRFEVGECEVTYRYRLERGDFISRQVLGCRNAIKTGRLACSDPEAVMKKVLKTKAVIGIVGPDSAVEDISALLAGRYSGVIVTSTTAEWVGYSVNTALHERPLVSE